jgi:hypothetical protein
MAQMRNRYKCYAENLKETSNWETKISEQIGKDIKIYIKEMGYQVKCKGEVRPKTDHEGPEGE